MSLPANLIGRDHETFEAAIVNAAWAIIVEDLMPAETSELHAAVEP